MTVSVKRSEFTDFEVLQGLVPDGRTDVVPLGRGAMEGHMTHIAIDPAFGVAEGGFSRGVRLGGVMSEHRWVLSMLLSVTGRASARDRELAGGDLILIAPGQERYNVYRGSARYAAALATPDELRSFLANEPGALDTPVWRQPFMVQGSDPVTAASKARQMAVLTDALAVDGLSDQAADFYKRNILELVTAPFRDASRFRGTRPASNERLVREVERYFMQSGNRPIHVSELCERFKVPRRTLYHAFQDVLGMPPITLLRHKRLADVHTELLNGGHRLIRDIAIEHGFLDMSKFAGEYNRLFGERPSDTLQRGLRLF